MRGAALRVSWVVAGILAAAVAARAAESVRITPTVRDQHVVVSFELNDAFNRSVRETIASGLRTTFTYDLELRTKVPAWFDRVIATTTVTVSDQYDNLTRQHALTRAVDGRIEQALVTEDEAVVRSWLTTARQVPLCETAKLDPARDYYVRVTTRKRPDTGSIVGLTRGISGEVRFTFIP